MRLEKVPFSNTHSFSAFFLDYISQNSSLAPFYGRFPLVENVGAQIKEKSSFSLDKRLVLVSTLKNQYKDLQQSTPLKNNLDSLGSGKTFTVTTGHQLNIFTGPLYFIYKIVTVINACRQLKTAYPDFHFVPVYWMASEDHDFEEISYFKLYGKKYTWQTDQKGAVGRFDPKSLANLLKEIPGDTTMFRDAYLKHKTLSDAVRYYVNELFGDTGLVVIDADDRAFKNFLKPVIKDDLFNHSSKKKVDDCNQQLASAGYKTQVHARDINLFYVDKGVRSRIEQEGDKFTVVETPLCFSKSQIEQLVEAEPEKFSPNVILRPLYQEIILPNLAYVGGPAEVVYWLQLKDVFENYGVPFPMLMPRNFALIIDAVTNRKLEKTGMQPENFFDEKNALFSRWVTKYATHDLDLGVRIDAIQDIYKNIVKQVEAVDKTLGPAAGAETKRVMRGLETIESKMRRAEKRLHSEKLRQIEAVKDALFPSGNLQERHDNFLTFYQQDPTFIQQLLTQFEPFDFRFNILTYTS